VELDARPVSAGEGVERLKSSYSDDQTCSNHVQPDKKDEGGSEVGSSEVAGREQSVDEQTCCRGVMGRKDPSLGSHRQQVLTMVRFGGPHLRKATAVEGWPRRRLEAMKVKTKSGAA
jgi:hypothetical protein